MLFRAKNADDAIVAVAAAYDFHITTGEKATAKKYLKREHPTALVYTIPEVLKAIDIQRVARAGSIVT